MILQIWHIWVMKWAFICYSSLDWLFIHIVYQHIIYFNYKWVFSNTEGNNDSFVQDSRITPPIACHTWNKMKHTEFVKELMKHGICTEWWQDFSVQFLCPTLPKTLWIMLECLVSEFYVIETCCGPGTILLLSYYHLHTWVLLVVAKSSLFE